MLSEFGMLVKANLICLQFKYLKAFPFKIKLTSNVVVNNIESAIFVSEREMTPNSKPSSYAVLN